MGDLFKEQLITIVQGFPVLYDHTRPDYKDIIKKGNSWIVVASQVGQEGK